MKIVTSGAAFIILSVVFFSNIFNTHAAAANNDQSLTRHRLPYQGLERDFLMYQPDNAGNKKLPVVIVLHGGGGDAENAVKMTGFADKARRENFIAVFPNGTARRNGKLKTWNAGHCCAYAMRHHVDDVGFISALIDQLVRDHNADANRIYVTGMSNGGIMAHRLGIELAAKVTAIAPVVAGLFGDEKPPQQPVAAIIINGALDQAVPSAGGPLGGRAAASASDGTPFKPAVFQAQFWASANGCKADPLKKHPEPTVEVLDYNCPHQDVQHYVVSDNGHAWPGGNKGSRRGDEPSTALAATDVIWNFFYQHSRHP